MCVHKIRILGWFKQQIQPCWLYGWFTAERIMRILEKYLRWPNGNKALATKDALTTIKKICSTTALYWATLQMVAKLPASTNLFVGATSQAAPTNSLIYVGGLISSRLYKSDL